MPASPPIELERFYYLAHFRELLADVEAKHHHLLTPEARTFLDDFRGLRWEAQALYVRIANRKGYLFRLTQLQYEELGCVDDAVAELHSGNWVRTLHESDHVAYLQSLTKSKLIEALRSLEPDGRWRASWRKDQLVSHLSQFPATDVVDDEAREEVIVQGRADDLNYLFFLYFGRIETGLTRFAMRDLGLIRSNRMQVGTGATFESKAVAKEAFFFASLVSRMEEATEVELAKIAERVDQWPAGSDEDLLEQRERALNKLGRKLERFKNLPVALDVYQRATTYPATERAVRLMLKKKDKDQARNKLEQMIAQPSSDEELLFAEDLYARTFAEQRRSPMTDWLRAANSMDLDESGRGRVEWAVARALEKQGAKVFLTENQFWNTLFGIWFWDELFHEETAAISNSFEHRPRGLSSGSFYRDRKPGLEAALQNLLDRDRAIDWLDRMVTQHEGTPNFLFTWQDRTIEAIRRCIELDWNTGRCDGVSNDPLRADPTAVLRPMLLNLRANRSGFPDLLVIQDGRIQWVEVKSEGDQIRRHQLKQIQRMREAGFDVSVLRVNWVVDPDQDYVVVDVETTGGRAQQDRITEIGAVRVRGGQIVDQWTSLINPQRRIPSRIVQLTGITNQMVASAPTFADIADDFRDFVGDAVFVAHHVTFDYGFIRAEFARLSEMFRYPTLCTVVGTRKYFPGLPSYSLGNLTRHFGIELSDHHRALPDARATAQLLMRVTIARTASFPRPAG